MLHRVRAAGLGVVMSLASAVPAKSCYPLLLPGHVRSEPSNPGCGLWAGSREPWPLFTALVSTLPHKGKSQALLSAPTGCKTS